MPNLLNAPFRFWKRPAEAARQSMDTVEIDRSLTQLSFGITPTPQMRADEEEGNDLVLKSLEVAIRASGLFRAEKVGELISLLREGSAPFERLNTSIAFQGNEVLSADEKRAMGLNTRMKYTRDFISFWEPSKLKSIEPKSILRNMHLRAFHLVARRRELIRFKKLGFLKQVRIASVNCPRASQARGLYDLDRVPSLPLEGCSEPYCICYYEPVIPDSL